MHTLENGISTLRHHPLITLYAWLFCITAPITSFLLFPSIQGTTPGLLMAMASPFLIILLSPTRKAKNYILLYSALFASFWTYQIITQAINLYAPPPSIRDLTLILPYILNTSTFFRSSMFTQALYLWAGIHAALFAFFYYDTSWRKMLKVGLLFFCAYGLYEFIYFLLFQTSGDFFSNRTFDTADGGERLGSLFQTKNIMGIEIMRVKSLSGEPSMFALSVVPLWIFLQRDLRLWQNIMVFSAIVLTVSTSAMLCLLVMIILHGVRTKKGFLIAGVSVVTVIVFFSVFNRFFMDYLGHALGTLRGETFSGIDRWQGMITHLTFYFDLNILHQFFGIGWGTVRSTDFVTTLLVNQGLIGTIIFSMLYLGPFYRLYIQCADISLGIALVASWVVMMISVPEFSYLPPWILIGAGFSHFRRLSPQRTSSLGLSPS